MNGHHKPDTSTITTATTSTTTTTTTDTACYLTTTTTTTTACYHNYCLLSQLLPAITTTACYHNYCLLSQLLPAITTTACYFMSLCIATGLLPPRLPDLNVVVRLHPCGGEIDVDALNVRADAALKQPLDGPFNRRSLHLVLQVVTEDAIKLLNILHAGGDKGHDPKSSSIPG